MVDGGGGDFWIFVDFQLILLEMGVLVHPQRGLRFGAALPFFFVQKKQLLKKNIDFQMSFVQNTHNLH